MPRKKVRKPFQLMQVRITGHLNPYVMLTSLGRFPTLADAHSRGSRTTVKKLPLIYIDYPQDELGSSKKKIIAFFLQGYDRGTDQAFYIIRHWPL